MSEKPIRISREAARRHTADMTGLMADRTSQNNAHAYHAEIKRASGP